MGKVAFIFPGQGSQAVGMGKALYDAFPEAKAVFDEADDALGEKLSSSCFEGPDEALKLTANTQPAILTVSVAAHAVFAKRRASSRPSWPATRWASTRRWSRPGRCRFADAVQAVRARGTFMQEAVPEGVGAMGAVLGPFAGEGARSAAPQAAQGEVVAPANFNEPVADRHRRARGRRGARGRAAQGRGRQARLAPAGERALPLRADAAGGAPARGGAEGRSLLRADLPVVTNVEAEPNADASRIAPLLLSQVTGSVRWMECVQALEKNGVDPRRRARARQGALGPGEAHRQGHRVPQRRRPREPGEGARGERCAVKDFENKVALVTGGSRGIGRAIAVELGQRGALRGAHLRGQRGRGRRDGEAHRRRGRQGQGGALRRGRHGGRAPRRSTRSSRSTAGLDVLVNNAGVAIDGLVMRFKDEDWDKTLDTNLTGAFALIRAASRPMMKQQGGAIVNVSSVVGETGNGGQAAYAASKAGLLGLTKSVAKELASRNIRVNAVTPGFIDTDMTAGFTEDLKNKMLEQIPLGRLGSAEEIAKAVAFLASDGASYITGATLKVNGGMYM